MISLKNLPLVLPAHAFASSSWLLFLLFPYATIRYEILFHRL